MSDILPFSRITPADAELVGGKALSLATTANAGLPVPPGFCVTTSAYRRHLQSKALIDPMLLDSLVVAYRELGEGPVAVRSSATAEDGAVTSFAGQGETILGVEGIDGLKAAVEQCWQSLHTERSRAYRERQGVDDAGLAMAVVVQRLVDAEVAGVLFTRDPLDATGALMRVEASWGLGEVVVSGRVTPDRFQIERESSRVHDRHAGNKQLQVTLRGETIVQADRQRQLCLTDHQLAQLADLGRKVEAVYNNPRDIEWAIADGKVWLLQARPITTSGPDDRDRVRRDIISRLAALVEPGGTVWSRTNLVEILPEPTPMTWAVVSTKLLSGGGGTGAMYRDFGFRPDPVLASMSAYDLIAGRPYLNLSREPRLEAAKPLAGYPLDQYKQSPQLALDPKRENPSGLRKWLGLLGLVRVAAKIASTNKKFPTDFRLNVVPEFSREVTRSAQDDLTTLDPPALVARFEQWVDRTLVAFARHSLKPTLLAQFSWQVVEQQIGKALGQERARATVAALAQGAKADGYADLGHAIRELASGNLAPADFLLEFGHRGPNEMELAAPRWAENPSVLSAIPPPAPHIPVPLTADVLARVTAEVKWNAMLAKSMAGHVERLQRYLGLRETGKHHLMRGYAEIRRTLVELDRRFGLEGGVFFLLPDELPALIAGKDLKPVATERRKTRAIELSLEAPPVLLDNDLEAIGRPLPPPSGAVELAGIPLSAGVAEGPALVLTDPSRGTARSGYILVCPSTDPAWVPLFVNARALVMESGGTLSHGAIVAREFGLPAVAGLPGVQHLIKTGQRLRVDGGRGTVSLLR